MEAYNAAFTSKTLDVTSIRAVTDMMTRDCLFIPFCEAGMGNAQRHEVVCDFGERGGLVYYNPEDAWINK